MKRTAQVRVGHNRTFVLGCLGAVVLVGAVFWRPIAIFGWWQVARCSSSPQTVQESCSALARLGPSSLPALARLAESPDLERVWSARAAIEDLRARVPEANAPIHDLLLSNSSRVRAIAAIALVEAGDPDPNALTGCIDALGSSDADARLLAAFALAWVPAARFEKEVPKAAAVFMDLARALSEARTDPRTVAAAAVAEQAQTALRRLDPAFEKKEPLAAALEKEAGEAYAEAKAHQGDFFK